MATRTTMRHLQLDDVLIAAGDAPVATRIAATIGPASNSVETLSGMLSNGMKIARLDFTYGTLELHLESYQNLRKAMQATNSMCAVMINPAGTDVHVLNRADNAPISLTQGQTVRVTNDATQRASSTVLPVNWPGSFTESGLGVGSAIFVGQYLFSGAETSSAYLTVNAVEANSVECTVNNSCILEGVQLSVKLDGTARSPLPCLSAEDERQLAAWAAATASADAATGATVAAGEFVSLPRTRNAADVAHCREVLARVGMRHAHVFARLDDLEGLVNHADILAAADGVVFSRGNLGTCMEAEKVFLAQKMLLSAANSAGKPVFVTRIVDTMTDAPRPTRAEATDVANLVLDGADGVLLGSETFRGKYPVDTVRTVAAICRAAEGTFDNYAYYRYLTDSLTSPLDPAAPRVDRAEALAASAVRAAHKVAARLIVVFTVTGRTARLLAKYKPQQPILTVVCTDPSAAIFSPLTRSGSPNAVEGAVSELSPRPHAATPASPEKPMKKVGSDTLLNANQLQSWSQGVQAKRCLVYRGAVPVMVDAPTGSRQATGSELLEAVLEYAKEAGLVASGDRVVVSQCPRKIDSQVMSEAGVVQLITVDQKLL